MTPLRFGVGSEGRVGNRLSLLAPAKINLALHVTGRRSDGYHLLDSIVAFADFGDQVEVTPARELCLTVSGPFAAHAPGDETDLAWRAAEAFFAHTRLRARASIHVEKNIPAQAGLGGGSADAAAVLRGLDELFQTRLSDPDLAALGLPLGADVPMCLAGKALRARGIGDEIELLNNWPTLPLLMVWPGARVGTVAVYSGLERRDGPALAPPPRSGSAHDIAAWLVSCRNDLEAPAGRIAPVIGEVLDSLRATKGCLLARMSGSGSACFGVYSDQTQNAATADRLAGHQLRRWVKATAAR